MAGAAEPVVTILADFEDDAVAATVGQVENASRAACGTRRPVIPARGQRCLALDIGVTQPGATATCVLRFREPRRFDDAERLAAFFRIEAGEVRVALRIRDADGRIFETPEATLDQPNRWIRIESELIPEQLRSVAGDGELSWPIEVEGFRATTSTLGLQPVYIDDLQIHHRVDRSEMLLGDFIFDEPTRMYGPGATVGTVLALENRSRDDLLQVTVDLAWTRPDGTTLKAQRASVNLPPSGIDFRSRQTVDFSQKIEQPGLYRLVARVRARDWITSRDFTAALLVTPSNRMIPRGRSTFFGVRADLFREPPADQRLEIAIARDVGAHLLAVDTPWQQIEPGPDEFEFEELDVIVDSLVQQDIAPLLVLTSPPAWLDEDDRAERIGRLLSRLTRHYGARARRFLLADTVWPSDDLAKTAAAIRNWQEALPSRDDVVHILPPPIDVQAASAEGFDAARLTAPDAPGWVFKTTGTTPDALAALERFRAAVGFDWRPAHSWLHFAAPLAGPSYSRDAELVLEHYVQAALAGVGSLIWYDLRDNDNDPSRPDALRGLVRRDFSPKASLQGYASAAGMLTGVAARGVVLGAPDEFQSALFVGSERQIAVLFPRANRVLPAVVGPVQGVAGELAVHDFERRSYPLVTSDLPPLVTTRPQPIFITLRPESAQPEPQLALVQPWLRVPRTVFAGASFQVELKPPRSLPRGAVRFVPPNDANYMVEPIRRAFALQADETWQLTADISAPPSLTAAEPLELRVYVDEAYLSVPLIVRPQSLVEHWSGEPEDLLDPALLIGTLETQADRRPSANVLAYAGYDRRYLHLLIGITDDRYIETDPQRDRLLLGIAAEGYAEHAELEIDLRGATLAPIHAEGVPHLDRWSVRQLPQPEPENRQYYVQIPSRSFDRRFFKPGDRLLIGIRYTDEDADGFPATRFELGGGLDGSRTTDNFHWLRLKAP